MNIAKIVREAREQSRLTTLDFATGIFDDFIQLHGDRSFQPVSSTVGPCDSLLGCGLSKIPF